MELVLAAVGVIVAFAMILASSKRSRKPSPKAGEPHSTIDPLDVVAADRTSSAMARRSRGGDGEGRDGGDSGSGGD